MFSLSLFLICLDFTYMIGGVIPVALIVFFVASIIAVVIVFTSRLETPPGYYTAYSSYLGFIVAVTWIFIISNEAVSAIRVSFYLLHTWTTTKEEIWLKLITLPSTSLSALHSTCPRSQLEWQFWPGAIVYLISFLIYRSHEKVSLKWQSPLV